MAMNIEVKHALRALEERIKALETKAKEVSAVTITTPVELDAVEKPKERKLCPKCGVKPAYFFHVRTCTGQKEEKQDAENTVRRRDPGTT